MRRYAPKHREVARMLSAVEHGVASLAKDGHEIALHVHPHWEDTRWTDDGWNFSGTRYHLRGFGDTEVADMFLGHTKVLNDLAEQQVESYRAGGFCIEPFSRIAKPLAELGILTDSSIVPGASLCDGERGFDFSDACQEDWWEFNDSPSEPAAGGAFVEIPVTPQRLAWSFYWRRMAHRLFGRGAQNGTAQGSSKPIGRREILRRLSGGSRVVELSIDEPKVESLVEVSSKDRARRHWHIMGHPKLISRRSLTILGDFIDAAGVDRFYTVAEMAAEVRHSRVRSEAG